MITPSVRHMAFKPENMPLHYIPGQFVTFHFEINGVSYNRSYSIASIPGQTDTIEIAVSPFPGGPGTEFLFQLKPGDSVETTGPFGRLVLRDEKPKRYILVATGTGVTPYRAMLPELQQRLFNQADLEVIILQGVQTPQDLLYGNDFLTFASKHPRLKFYAFYSREVPPTGSKHEFHGYVQHHFKSLDLSPTQDIVYLCGNPNMIDEAFNFLLDVGFNTTTIRREKYISPKK